VSWVEPGILVQHAFSWEVPCPVFLNSVEPYSLISMSGIFAENTDDEYYNILLIVDFKLYGCWC